MHEFYINEQALFNYFLAAFTMHHVFLVLNEALYNQALCINKQIL